MHVDKINKATGLENQEGANIENDEAKLSSPIENIDKPYAFG